MDTNDWRRISAVIHVRSRIIGGLQQWRLVAWMKIGYNTDCLRTKCGVNMAEYSSKVTELRFTVDADFLKRLQDRLGVDKGTEVARSALTLLDWASTESSNGRVILSSTGDGKDVHRLVMPELMNK
jgi:hypothetical protein